MRNCEERDKNEAVSKGRKTEHSPSLCSFDTAVPVCCVSPYRTDREVRLSRAKEVKSRDESQG